MAPSVPTCAARVIRNRWLEYGWGAALTPETNRVVNHVKGAAEAMYSLQLSRDRAVDAASIRHALFWEHRQLTHQRIVSTPAIDFLGLFARDHQAFDGAIVKIHRSIFDDFESVQIHPLFEGIRDREYTVWPIDVDGSWVTVILRVQQKPPSVQKGENADDRHLYFDREVTEVAIIDPLPKDRDRRRTFINRRLAKILAEGSIDMPREAAVRSIGVEDTENEWETGYIVYAVVREFFRRLKVLLYRRQFMPDTRTDILWTGFEEHYNIDSYRESLMAACAHQTIEKSGYLIRMALEVPSEKAKHNPNALSHTKAPSVVTPPEQVPDELFTSNHSSASHVIVEIPEHLRHTVPREITVHHHQEKSESAQSESAKAEVKDESNESEGESERDTKRDSELQAKSETELNQPSRVNQELSRERTPEEDEAQWRLNEKHIVERITDTESTNSTEPKQKEPEIKPIDNTGPIEQAKSAPVEDEGHKHEAQVSSETDAISNDGIRRESSKWPFSILNNEEQEEVKPETPKPQGGVPNVDGSSQLDVQDSEDDDMKDDGNINDRNAKGKPVGIENGAVEVDEIEDKQRFDNLQARSSIPSDHITSPGQPHDNSESKGDRGTTPETQAAEPESPVRPAPVAPMIGTEFRGVVIPGLGTLNTVQHTETPVSSQITQGEAQNDYQDYETEGSLFGGDGSPVLVADTPGREPSPSDEDYEDDVIRQTQDADQEHGSQQSHGEAPFNEYGQHIIDMPLATPQQAQATHIEPDVSNIEKLSTEREPSTISYTHHQSSEVEEEGAGDGESNKRRLSDPEDPPSKRAKLQ
ncbi:hypothetical protein F5B20DRAFT_550295 [Whalleya microplaca]|nr:hypothetical protein F5B20DRAFT_550295 [Whalleya microplaca]